MSIDLETVIRQTSDDIFKAYSLPQVQQISQELEVKANETHEQLRQLVASKYRDLLSTADEIIDMNNSSKEQDKKLYELSFFKSSRLSKNTKIEKNLDLWINGLNDGKVELASDLQRRRTKVITNSRFFLEFSKLLNLNNDDDWRDILQTVKRIPLDEEWFRSRKKITNEKFKELEMILINKVKNIKNLEELLEIYHFFIENHQIYEFDLDQFEEILSKRLLNLASIENVSKILQNFQKFKPNILEIYRNEIISRIQLLTDLIVTIDLENGKEEEKELNLYDLDPNNDREYLQNIQYLNNGLILKDYQTIDNLLKQSFKTLQILEKVDKVIHDENLGKLREIIEKFKSHANKRHNKSLFKYLNKILI